MFPYKETFSCNLASVIRTTEALWRGEGFLQQVIVYNNFARSNYINETLYFSPEGAPCDINVTPVGCFKDDPNNSIMDEIFYSEKLPGTPNYGGHSLHSSQNFKADFPEFLCRCARYAKGSGWQYFGVKELGELGTEFAIFLPLLFQCQAGKRA